MRITSLGSGSSGNAYLVEAGPQRRTRLLVDAGFHMRVLRERLALVGCTPGDLRGVLITHEHSDHIMGLPPLLKYYQVPVYADPRTLGEIRAIIAKGEMRSETGALVRLEIDPATDRAVQPALLPLAPIEAAPTTEEGAGQPAFLPLAPIEAAPTTEEGAGQPALLAPAPMEAAPAVERGAVRETIPALRKARLPWDADLLWQALPEGTSCVIGDIEVYSFPVSHDAIAPCGYLLSAGGCRVCIITDSGKVTPVMLEALAQADLLILEANHDRARLLSGPYPYSLKQRILSATGHLSNAQAAEAVLHTWRSDAVRWLWLAHLSRTNNTHKLALASMQESLHWAGASLEQLHITVLSHEMGGTWDSSRLWIDDHLWRMV
jgi:phosphoribosyl 1,2-cyclic phosphodiesterase